MEEDQYDQYKLGDSGYVDSQPQDYVIGNNGNYIENASLNSSYNPSQSDIIAQQAMLDGYSPEDQEEDQFLGFSESKPKEGLYALFNKVLTLPNSSKVGNVDKQELGDMGLSVREGLRIALLGNTFGHAMFANFFASQANIITDTSMAKKGWFTELFVTAKRFTEKSLGSGPGSGSSANSQANLPEQRQGKLSNFFMGKKQ